MVLPNGGLHIVFVEIWHLFVKFDMVMLFTFCFMIVAKTRKEAKLIATMDSVSVMKARVEELRKIVEDQKQRKDEYGAILFQQSEGD